ncbi:ABC transporter substrate-binding protein [Desulfobacula sp.]|uniref:ABC transporter substrate-binding protein n=1 Tax=Desulfobacula sp. TaxID=2593537 RepID=UPI0025C53B2E|nr:ABC transporter substrate-binding protein [Desulfobacula sp.]
MIRLQKGFIYLICWGFFLFFLGACSPPQQSDIFSENRTGIKSDEILIGSSLALGGHAGYLGTQMLQGAMSYIRDINQKGGIHNRKINLIALDDRYNPTQCLYNTQKLILEKRVFALFCYVGTPTTVRIIPLVNEAGIPLVGMFTGANRLRQPVNRYLINIRASYYQETQAAVDLIIKKKNFDKVAVFYQYDEYGFDGLRGTEIALKKYGLLPVAKGSYVRGTLDVEAGLEKIIQSNAQAVVMIGTYDSCAKFINLAKERNFSPLFHNVSFVGSKELARRLGANGEGVIVTQVVPPPNYNAQPLPGVKEYVSLLNTYYPDSKPSFVGLEGYLNARILAEGLKRAGKDITREKFIRAIESIDQYDLGIQNPLSFGKNDYQGLDNVYYTMIKQGELVLIK